MEPPSAAHDANNCLHSSYLINSSSATSSSNLHKQQQQLLQKQQLFYVNETTSRINEQSSLNQSTSQQLHPHLHHPYYQQQQANIVAAKASSYYSLTPASSTTSLNDFSLHISNETILNNKKQLKKKPSTTSTLAVTLTAPQPTPVQTVTLLRTSSKKRTRTSTVEAPVAAAALNLNQGEEEEATVTTTATHTLPQPPQTVATVVAKRRGRPPKNSLVASAKLTTTVAAAAVTLPVNHVAPIAQPESVSSDSSTVNTPIPPVMAPVAQPETTSSSNKNGTTSLSRYNSIDSTTYSRTANNKLIKSLINKCSSNSNLQKSKVAVAETTIDRLNASATTTPTNQSGSSVLTNKINKSNNVNTKQQPPQPQITDYLVENNKYTKQQLQENLSDTENRNTSLLSQQRTPTKMPSSTNLLAKLQSTATAIDPQMDPFSPTTPMPKLSWANNNELWQVMRRKELKYAHDPNYLKRHLNIEPQMRAILLDWLVEISYAYRLHRETWYLALEYMDRFLTCSKQQMRVDRLQLIGMTSLFLAAKVEEIYPPKLKELAAHMESYSLDNEDAISQFELFMLKTLNWEISPVTANTWLMTYLQIASINYYSILNQDNTAADKTHNTSMVMPLNIYKNSNLSKFGLNSANNESGGVSQVQQQFYLENYMKSVTLLDLCMFDMESLRFSYSVLAASAIYHMITPMSANLTASNQNKTPFSKGPAQQAALLVQACTGYKLYELDACIKWMYPYADVCKEVITEEKMIQIKMFSSIDAEDSHNIQLYHQNLEFLKEVQTKKTPSKFYSNSNLLLTPPDSHRKFSSSSSSASCSYISDSNSTILSTPQASSASCTTKK